MLEELVIQDYILIENLSLPFGNGLTVLTGETGTGKSILIGALSLLFGAKADVSLIRKGAKEARISGRFVIRRSHPLHQWLKKRGIHCDNDEILVQRTLKANARGAILIQTVPATRSDLVDFASLLCDLHSQHEHQSLFSTETQRRLLDRYAGIEQRVELFGEQFEQTSELRQQYKQLLREEKDKDKELDYLHHAVEEIQKAQLKEGEEEELEKKIKRLSQHDQLVELVESTYDMFSNTQTESLRFLMKRISRHLQQIAEIDTNMKETAQRFENIFFESEDVFEEINAYRLRIMHDPRELKDCESRFSLIQKLESKYGSTIKDVLVFLHASQERLRLFEHIGVRKEELEQQVLRQEQELLQEAKKISDIRQRTAGELSQAIEKVLGKLGMDKARFVICCEEKKNREGGISCTSKGIDNIFFHIAVNPGEDMRTIRAAASGGELSRIMLAIKTIFADSDTLSILVFDEIDSGIGGEVGRQVAAHLEELGAHKQVFSITHLASVAACADTHIKVEKYVQHDRTHVRAIVLDDKRRIQEIARMLAGDQSQDVSLDHARTLLEKRSKVWLK